MVAAVIESLLNKWELLSRISAWLWVEALCFSLITHVVFGLVVCTGACLVGASTARWVRRLGDRLRPAPLALAGLLVGEAVMAGWGIALVAGADLPGGPAGLACAAAVWLVALVPVGWVCLRLGRGLVGRGLGPLSRVAVWPATALLVAAIVVQWHGRPQLQSADGFWPPAASSQPVGSSHDRPPDVVLVVADALRADRLGCYGYDRPTSPHIDAFAADAVVYDRVVSPGAWTIPAHASIFTGLYPSQHGARFGLQRLWLDDGFVTLAEALHDRGYQTLALSNNPIVSPATNLTQGFQRFAEPADFGRSAGSNHLGFFRHVLNKVRFLGPLLARWFSDDAGGHTTTAFVARWLRDRDRSRPVFLFINYMETHDPYEPPQAYRRQFVQSPDVNRSYRIDQSSTTVWQYALAGKPVYTPHDVEILSDLYDGRVRELDDHFADLIAVLDAELDLDRTVVVLTADHGENLGERGLLGHQFCIYNTLVHVPLIVRWPGALRPQRVDRLVQTCDLFPTLLAWSRAEARQTAKVMARPLVSDPPTSTQDQGRYAYAEYLFWPASPLETLARLDPAFDPSRWQTAYRAVFHDRWKLILASGGRFELYDLRTDPGETRNLVASHQPIVASMAGQVGRWLGSFKRFDPSQATSPKDRRLDDEQRQRLRDLGYVGS